MKPPIGSEWSERPPYGGVVFSIKSHDAPDDYHGRPRVLIDRGPRTTKARADRFHYGSDYRPKDDAARAFVAEMRAAKGLK